ncbi:glycerol kinase [Rhizobium sp. Root274]|uniref:FGGY family carbohydrate kinase n=1 Tax=unclassified Rhizobium TaxID=2613769 RepID=UPI0007125EB3|nr:MULTISPECIES: FGGY family carbohydrate kinase [unclassified Rhizobium]KQW32338.1 glycerol kinase [Rhizobium sp. Root1240]KRD33173.1 glycerol kinase [Rhizobium sp. Root274]
MVGQQPFIIAIDQGTTNTKAVLVDASGMVVSKASVPLTSHYPHPGWAEQSADAIWQSVQAVIADIVAGDHGPITGIAISNQRETLVVWDAETGEPLAPAILWQCRRSAAACQRLIDQGHNGAVAELTGLSINALFPASKLGWVMENIAGAPDLAAQGRLRAGTVDSWLLFKMTAGAVFATDHSNASRTMLFDTARLAWSPELCSLFNVPLSALPQARASNSRFGETAPATTALPAGTPILSMMGDSHAALYGHGVRTSGLVKATYGTGSSLMTLTERRLLSDHGLSSTIAWSDDSGVAYALEGNITVSAQAIAFVATLLGLSGPTALSDLAQSVPDSGKVVFVPALAGLGAPHWTDDATGTISGMTHATTPAHIARATMEAVALQITDVFEAMQQDSGLSLSGLMADGGASTNEFLMQLQADLLDRPVLRGDQPEVGALGAAAMAFGAMGITAPEPAHARRFTPGTLSPTSRANLLARWREAVARAKLPISKPV